MTTEGGPDSERGKAFFDRADAIVALANAQAQEVPPEDVSASLLFAASRYHAFITAARAHNAENMQAARDGVVDYFLGQYRMMLLDNLDDYIRNFPAYMGRG
ncbi:MAG TPA: DUF3144 domain-containing protein [Hyphomonadaceae bacterium]|nr:DUF3144 domain-containing protein [Hyphomonadaceae bacterium]